MRTAILILLFLLSIILGPIVLSGGIMGNYGDIYLYYYPQKFMAKECIINGAMPLWNPYVFAGTPFLANPQTAVFYPLSLLFYLFPLTQSFNWFYFVHLFLGGLFFMLFLLSWKKNKYFALLGGIVFVFSSFIFLRLAAGHPVILSGYIWLPLVMLFANSIQMQTDLSRCKQKFVRGICINPSESIYIALALSLCFLSGHTQPFYMTILFLVLFTIFARLKSIPTITSAGVLFLLLTAVQWLPTTEFVQNSMRINNQNSSLWSYQVTTSYSLPLRNLLSLILPNMYGNPQDKNFIALDHPSVFFETHCLYFGLIPLILSLIGLTVSIYRQRFFLPLVLIFSLFLAFGAYTPIYKMVQNILPGLSFLRAPARFYFLVLFSAILLMVAGLEDINKIGRINSATTKTVRFIILILVVIDLFIWNQKFIFSQNPDNYLSSSPISKFSQFNINNYRFVSDETTPNHNKAMLHHLYNINGYDALFLRNFVEYINQTDKGKNSITTVGLKVNDYTSPVLTSLSARFFLTKSDVSILGKPVFQSNDVKIYENRNTVPMIYGIEETNKKIVFPRRTGFFQPKHICEINIHPKTKLLISGIAYPGWNIFADNNKITGHFINPMIKTIDLNFGEYFGNKKIVMLYQSLTFQIGLLITTGTMLVLLYFGFKLYIRNREIL